mgnify:CR=1 FL=1
MPPRPTPWPFSPEARRRRLCRTVAAGPLRDYLEAPLPDLERDYRELKLLAVDLETTGLEPRRDHILSLGFVPLDGERIRLSGARRLLVRPPVGVAESAAVHGLTDDGLARGLELREALPQLLSALRGRALLAHHAPLEERFLAAACRRLYGAPLVCLSVDTLRLERRLVGQDGSAPREDDLRLYAARARRGLPRYRAHDALADALACAELYLAQASLLANGGRLTLRALRR